MTDPAAITFFVIAVVLAAGIVLYFVAKGCMLYHSRKSGEIRLPTTA